MIACICQLFQSGALLWVVGAPVLLLALWGLWSNFGCKWLGHEFRTEVYAGLKAPTYDFTVYQGEIKEVTCARCRTISSREIFEDCDRPFEARTLQPGNRYQLYTQKFLRCQKLRTEKLES